MSLAVMNSNLDEAYDLNGYEDKETLALDNLYSFCTGKKLNNGGNGTNAKKTLKKYVYPIKDTELIKKIKENILNVENDRYNTKYRNYLLFVIGINIALRASDLRRLTWGDIFDNRRNYRDGIKIIEKKTNKERDLHYNKSIIDAVEFYLENMEIRKIDLELDECIFKTRQAETICTDRIGKLVKQWCEEVGLGNRYSSHSLRKTWSYHFYQKTKDIARLQYILGHEDQRTTMRYIDVTEETVATAFDEVAL